MPLATTPCLFSDTGAIGTLGDPPYLPVGPGILPTALSQGRAVGIGSVLIGGRDGTGGI